jgi:hypothetical protein
MSTDVHIDNELTKAYTKQCDESNENSKKSFDDTHALASNDGASQQLAEMDQTLLAQKTASHIQTSSMPVIATTEAKQLSHSNQ